MAEYPIIGKYRNAVTDFTTAYMSTVKLITLGETDSANKNRAALSRVEYRSVRSYLRNSSYI